MQDIIAMAKNMRAVLYLKEKDEDFIKFVLRYNRWRSIAVPDFVEIPEGKSFVIPSLPEKVRKFYSELNECEKVIFLSMLYIAPVLTTPPHLDDFEKYEITQIYANKNLDIREGLRHLRISEYSMLDYRLSEEKNIGEYISKDLKRFWRIRNGDVKVGSYCTIPIPDEVKEMAGGYAIVIGVEI